MAPRNKVPGMVARQVEWKVQPSSSNPGCGTAMPPTRFGTKVKQSGVVVAEHGER